MSGVDWDEEPGTDQPIDQWKLEVGVIEHDEIASLVAQAGMTKYERDEGDDTEDVGTAGRFQIEKTAGLKLPKRGQVQTLIGHS